MREVQYKSFSLRTHKKNWRLDNPNVCQFELTFGCGLHCKHCYTDCYNKPAYLRKELKTKDVKIILDKVYNAGAIWLCLTGGDPLIRKDFLEIYSYAKEKGFIITVFTSGCSVTEEITDYFKKSPPFVIEITLNAVTEDLYEKISQAKGSFEKVIKGIDLILKENLPLRIKTQVTKDNLAELPKIREFVEGKGLEFQSYSDLYARLDGDKAPCSLRISRQEIMSLNNRIKSGCFNEPNELNEHNEPNDSLFPCAISGGDGINIDPYGNMFLCNLIRNPTFNLLEVDIKYAFERLLSSVRDKKFSTDSRCKNCNLRQFCRSCPGRAFLEKGDMEAPIEYYCELAKV